MAAFSARSHAGRASAPWFGAAGRRTVVSGRRGDGGVGAASRAAGRRWCRGGAGDDGVDGAALVSGRRRGRRGGGVGRGEGKGIAGEGEGERGDRYEVGAAQY